MPARPPMDFSPFKRLKEAAIFVHVYRRDLLRFFLVFYLPVILVGLLVPGVETGADGQGPTIPMIALIFDFFYHPIYMGGLIYLLARIESGQPWSLQEGFVVGVRLWDKLLLANLISLVVIGIGFMAFVVPAIIAYARLAMVEFRIVLDGDDPFRAIKNSYQMTRLYMLPIIGSTSILFMAFILLRLVIDQLALTLGADPFLPFILDSFLTIAVMLMLTVLLFRFYGLANRRHAIVSS
ncbi:MAG: hypothetical protein QNJ02_16825 [Desulfobacterales bacterium]|nr:hypothetical protein [Desulfobacterales bacterium]MDJ0876938.1 hypothetical protein [Desulfobacterales bacterium]